MRKLHALAVAIAALLWGACRAEGEQAVEPRVHASGAQASETGEVVARVGDGVVTVSEVRALTEAAEISPREAAERLVREHLLAAEAARRGYAEDPEVRRAVRNAAAHALIHERVEDLWTAESLPKALVDETFAKAIAAGSKPESRREVEEQVRAHLVLVKRREALEALLQDLRTQWVPEYDEEGIARAFAADGEALP